MQETKNPNIYYGVATVQANGKTKRITDVTFKPSGVKYDDVNNGKGGVPVEIGAILKGKSFLARGDVIDDEGDVTITFKANTGHAFMIDHAWRVDVPDFSKDGFDLEYHGAESEVISNG